MPEAALVEVVAQVGGADLPALGVEHRRGRRPARLAVDRVLDLHHLGAEAGEHLGRVGERLHLLGGEHPDAVERLAERLRVGVGDVSEPHLVTVRGGGADPGSGRGRCVDSPA